MNAGSHRVLKRRAILAVNVLAFSFAGMSTGAAAVARTSLHLYAPFNGGGIARGVRVARSATGYCWTTSIGDSRSDTFRCFVGNYIHDPCFANTVVPSNFVFCPLAQPGSNLLRINLTKPLPSRPQTSNPTRYPPWFIQLANGQWCGRTEGATGLIAGLPISYGCTHGALLGNPHRSASLWTIFFAASFQASQFRSVAIRAAWW